VVWEGGCLEEFARIDGASSAPALRAEPTLRLAPGAFLGDGSPS